MLGVGGVGGLVGAALARGGEDVTLLMRPESLRAYSGVMRVESVALGDFEVDVPALPLLDAAVDVLWVTPKATQLELALRTAPSEVVGRARVVTLMNGVDHLRLLEQRYEQVIAGEIRVESERVAPGHIVQSTPFVRVELADGADIVDVLASAGIDATLGGDALRVLWQKLAFLAPVALATTAFDMALGEARRREEFRACQAEAISVGRAEGADLDPDALTVLTSGAPAELRSSMQKDRAEGLPLELDSIAGPIIRGGKAHAIPTPATEELVNIIAGAMAFDSQKAGLPTRLGRDPSLPGRE
jgi:2-dehydropantoate 2-reductase